MFATVDSFTEPWEAHLFCNRLEAENISAFVVHEYHIWVVWPYALALGGAKVQVPYELRNEAAAIRWMCEQGEFKKLLQDAVGDLDDDCCPYCSSHRVEKRSSIPFAAAAGISTIFLRAMFPAKATIHECQDCQHSWRTPLGVPIWVALGTALSGALATLLVLAVLSGSIWSLFYTHHQGAGSFPFSRLPEQFPVK